MKLWKCKETQTNIITNNIAMESIDKRIDYKGKIYRVCKFFVWKMVYLQKEL